MLEVVRQFEARMDSAVGAILTNGPHIPLLHEIPVVSAEVSGAAHEAGYAFGRQHLCSIWEHADACCLHPACCATCNDVQLDVDITLFHIVLVTCRR
jgi:hypothetical protein